MKRTAAIACLWAAMTGMAWGAGQIDIVRARHDVAPETHPNSAFWRGVPAVFAESDYTGDAVPGYRMEARSDGRRTTCTSCFHTPRSFGTLRLVT